MLTGEDEIYPVDTCMLVRLGLKQKRLKRSSSVIQIVLSGPSHVHLLRSPNVRLRVCIRLT